jgi:hypothetical protein
MARFLNEPPAGKTLTAYDREHMVLYLRLLDSARDGADWREVISTPLAPDTCTTLTSRAPAG